MSALDLITETSRLFEEIHECINYQERSQKVWDRRFLELARHISTWSKDPSTQCGSVITRGNRIVSIGFNGFPRGLDDSPELYDNRELKYKLIVHAELNALLFARCDLTGCTLYTWPMMSCPRCAGPVIQSGITRCVAPVMPADKLARWQDDMDISREMFRQAHIELVEVESGHGVA